MSITMGEVAFRAYVKAVGGKDVRGNPIPSWKELSESVKNGWEAAARAVVMNVDVYPVMEKDNS